MKKITFVIFVAFIIMSMPVMTTAQATEFQVINSNVCYDENGFDVALIVNWHSVAVVIRINGDFYEEDWRDGPNNTHLFFWFKYDHLGVDAGETGELTIELSNTTRVCIENDYALENPERILAFVFNVPFPEPEEYAIYEPPDNGDKSPPEIQPWPEDTFDYTTTLKIALFFGGMFAFIICVITTPTPTTKQEKTELELADGVKSLCDCDDNIGPLVSYQDFNNLPLQDGDSLRVEYEFDLDPDFIANALDADSTAKKLENALTDAFEKDVRQLFPEPNEHCGSPLIRRVYSNPFPPEEDTIQLPDLSSPDDDGDWRTCPYCGEWNRGKATRCVRCDGRLGRPLAR